MSQLGVEVTREENFSEWYVQTITRAGMVEYTDISGCYVFKPWSYSIWENIQSFLDGEFKKTGVKNAYFPCFVSQRALKAEADHLEGFAPEVAWVTRAGNSEMKEPIAIRPTSETIMYPLYSNWIRSHRDLPLKLNQWCNVVRWEFKHPVPFLRTREFLWQEGHTCFATKQEADTEVLQILDIYRQAFEDLLAVPVTRGKKTDKEKFAGGLYTTTCEAYIEANGRAIQACTSHCLGQNFAKIFNITYESEGVKEKNLVWQNSWGFTTRSIGIMTMVHGDNRGLVLPPRIAPIQVIIIPVYGKKNKDIISQQCEKIRDILLEAGVRVEADLREYKSAWKYNDWDLKGVPLRIEIGQNDYDSKCVTFCRRDNTDQEKKPQIPVDQVVQRAKETLIEYQKLLFDKALNAKQEHTKQAKTWEEFLNYLNSKNIVLVPFCCTSDCETSVKTKSAEESKAQATDLQFELTGAAKSLCIPFEQPVLEDGTKCFACGSAAVSWTLFGRSY